LREADRVKKLTIKTSAEMANKTELNGKCMKKTRDISHMPSAYLDEKLSELTVF
jgi:hypothetical protein